jgi:hypothetical protein
MVAVRSKAGATRAHKMRPLQRTYFAEDTTKLQNAVHSFLSAMEPEESVAFASRLFLQWTHFVRSCRRCLIRASAVTEDFTTDNWVS